MMNAGTGIIELDLHGLRAEEARKLIDIAISRADRSVYIVRIIHGYHRGDSIRAMVRREFGGGIDPRVIRLRGGSNPGITELILRDL